MVCVIMYTPILVFILSLVSYEAFKNFPVSIYQRGSFQDFRLYSSQEVTNQLTPKNGENNLEQALHDLFIQQLANTDDFEILDPTDIKSLNRKDIVRKLKAPAHKLIESETELHEGTPLEIIYKGRIMFGNYIGKINSNSIKIKLTSGREINIDIGQIIGIWDILSDENIPYTAEEWSAITAEAFEILGNMSPRKSDLNEFWSFVKSRHSSLSVDSFDLGVYIFQERKFRSWIDPFMSAKYSKVAALSSAQRYAAALLLFHDDIHFKRKTSSLSVRDEVEELLFKEDNKGFLNILEGGYKVLDESVATYKECEIFYQYYLERKKIKENDKTASENLENMSIINSRPFRASCITRLLRELEVFGLSSAKMAPPKTIKTLLKKLKLPPTTEGARKGLNEMGHDSPEYNPITKKNKKSTGGVEDNYTLNITPWTAEVVEVANKLRAEVSVIRQNLESPPFNKPGKKGPSGKMDYRASTTKNPVLCIDAKFATFLDDGFSLSPETGEILIHVADVVGFLRKYEILQETAKDRVSSAFLPTGPLHMLPPQALDALKLSTTQPNEVLTIALSIDRDSGQILGSRVFPSVIGPVFPLDIETANEIIEGVGVEEDFNEEDGENEGEEKGSGKGWKVSTEENEKSIRLGVPNQVIRDLRFTHSLIEKICSLNPLLDSDPTTVRRKSKEDQYGSFKIINTLLTLYSRHAFEYCQEKGLNVPLAWENRDKTDSSIPRRFATQPLRNWLSQQQQKQLRAALKMELPLSREECAFSVVHHNKKRKQMASFVGKNRAQSSFEVFENHCFSLQSVVGESEGHMEDSREEGDNGEVLKEIILNAEGLGKGGLVRIPSFNLNGLVNQKVEKGQVVRVRVKKINAETKTINLELVN